MSRDVENYRAAVRTVIVCARLLAPYDIRQLLRDIAFADGVAPILNPTLWIQNGEKMEEDAAILRAAVPLQELAEKLAAQLPANADVRDLCARGQEEFRQEILGEFVNPPAEGTDEREA